MLDSRTHTRLQFWTLGWHNSTDPNVLWTRFRTVFGFRATFGLHTISVFVRLSVFTRFSVFISAFRFSFCGLIQTFRTPTHLEMFDPENCGKSHPKLKMPIENHWKREPKTIRKLKLSEQRAARDRWHPISVCRYRGAVVPRRSKDLLLQEQLLQRWVSRQTEGPVESFDAR